MVNVLEMLGAPAKSHGSRQPTKLLEHPEYAAAVEKLSEIGARRAAALADVEAITAKLARMPQFAPSNQADAAIEIAARRVLGGDGDSEGAELAAELMQQRSTSQDSVKVLTRAEALQAEHVASLRVLAARAVHQTFETRQRALVAKIDKAADQLAALNSEAVQLSDEFCRETDSQLDNVECMRIGSQITGFEFLEMWRDEQHHFGRLPVAKK